MTLSTRVRKLKPVPSPSTSEGNWGRSKGGIMKPNIQLITAAVMSIGGLVLLFCGIFIAPQGQIHESLLIGFGEVATFAGALFGIDYTYKYRNKNGNHPPNQNEQG